MSASSSSPRVARSLALSNCSAQALRLSDSGFGVRPRFTAGLTLCAAPQVDPRVPCTSLGTNSPWFLALRFTIKAALESWLKRSNSTSSTSSTIIFRHPTSLASMLQSTPKPQSTSSRPPDFPNFSHSRFRSRPGSSWELEGLGRSISKGLLGGVVESTAN